jgi:glycosyltransferase involved in cell wall biosynthesis
MRVLLLTPFAPNLRHDHAAADTIVKLVPRLAQHVELFVFSPQHTRDSATADNLGYTMLPASAGGSAGVGARLGVKPGWLRQSWSRRTTGDVLGLVKRLRPDVVHAEYLQCAEGIASVSNSVLGIHDITESVMLQSLRTSTPMQVPYRMMELVRTRWFERAAIRRAAAVVTLSEADYAVASALNPKVILGRPGIEIDARQWKQPHRTARPRLVFAGAMWRRANALAALYLAQQVMPLVWQRIPDAELRVVGARPTPEVVDLARDRRIVVTGEVPDIRTEMLESHAVLAPTILGGGVLMKVVHAMALGCPVITSPGAAASVEGDQTTLFAAADAESLAAAVLEVVGSPALAAGRGANGRDHVAKLFRWENTVRSYLDAYTNASGR